MSKYTVSSDTVFKGKVFSIQTDRVRLPHGPEVVMHVVRHPASVILLSMPDPTHIVLVRQYRYAIDRSIWELPAGSVDPGETAEQAAIRECHEEIGQIPSQIDRLDAFYKMTGLEHPNRVAEADEDEDIEARVFTLPDARQLVASGDAPDMKTALGLALI